MNEMGPIAPYALNSVMNQGMQGVAGDLVSGADIRAVGNLDTAGSSGTNSTMDMISLIYAPYPA